MRKTENESLGELVEKRELLLLYIEVCDTL